MNTLSRNLFGAFILTWLGLSVAACSLFTFAPAATPTPTVTATATATATITPTPTPFNKDGWWGGEMSADATFGGAIQFSVENNRLNEVTLNYTLRVGGCSEMVVMNGTFDDTKMTGNDFTARAGESHDKRQLLMTGAFTSASAASGTLEFKGNLDGCGDFSKIGKWSARQIPPRPTRTPTLPPPTATQPRPTGTRVPATPGGAITPAGWTTLKSARFAITVPSGFQAQVPLQDVRLNLSDKQTVLSGDDRATGLVILVVETRGGFGSAEQWLEEAKKHCSDPRGSALVLKTQTDIAVNGRAAATITCSRSDYLTVEYFIRVEREDFQILVSQKQPADANFISNAERVANSFVVNAPTPRQTVAPDKSQAAELARAFFAALNARDLDAAFAYLDDSGFGVLPGARNVTNKADLRAYFQTQLAAGAQYTLSNFVDLMGEGIGFDLKVSTNPAISKGGIILSQKAKILALMLE